MYEMKRILKEAKTCYKAEKCAKEKNIVRALDRISKEKVKDGLERVQCYTSKELVSINHK
jgi:hypothetical protein